MSHHAPNPAPPWPPNANSSNGQPPPSVPGLNPQHLLSSQSSFEYNRTAIPGLSFAGSTQSWAVDTTNPSSHPTGPGLSGQERNADPKQNAPLAASLEPSQATAPVDIHAPITMEDDMMEEGELGESGFEDLYEPYLEPVEENNTAGAPSQDHSTDDEDYDPANPGSPVEPQAGRAPWPDEPLSAESPEEVRERSRSYSPYLSPHEVETRNSTAARVALNDTGSETQRQVPHLEDDQDANAPSSENLPDARKKAQAAILRLWPLEVRYQDYVEEGIDEKIVHTLFAGLGLDTKSAKANHNEQSQVLLPPETLSEAAQPTRPAQAPDSTVTAVTEVPQPAPAVTSEERKDRIARRLMAAKAAKQVSPGDTAQTLPTEVATHPSASTSQAHATAESKTATVSSQKKAEKERLLQEKLAKLQQSRASRAQKASEKASAASQMAIQEPSSAHVPRQVQTILPPAATHTTAEASTSQEMESAEGVTLPSQPAPPIPGLFLSPSGSPLANPRKRPVASDLNENSAAPPYKRTFNQNYVEKPLIINVSDGSDDEDIEMDMSSPVDDPAGEHPLANSVPPKSSSFRGHPPLTDKQIRRGLHSPASRTSNGTGAKDHDQAKLGHLDQNISELKQKIAERQRQKGKTTPKDSPAQSSNGTPVVETQQPFGTDVPPARSHSAGSSAALQHSPAPAEPDVQRALPKVRRASSGRGLDRRQRIRRVSDKLPTLDSSIATMDAKSRLFESQAARARKEADDLRAQRDQAYQEFQRLQAEESASPEPEQAQLPNGQQYSDEHVFSPSGDRDNLAAQTASPSDDLSSSRENADIPAISGSPRPETNDVEDRSEVPLPNLDSIPPVRSQAFEVVEKLPQPVVPPSEAGGAIEAVEDTAMDESPLAEEPQQASDVSSQSPRDEAMYIDTASDGDEAYNPPEPSTEHEADAQRLQAEILSPALADNSTPPILANADSQESGTESAALPDHISKGVSDAADDGLDLPPQVHDGRPTDAATNLTSYEQSESAPEISRTGFVPYESILKGFLSYRFHPNFHQDVAGGLKSPTYSNKINPQVQFCLDFLLGTCARGGSCKYQHIDAVGLSESQTLLQLGNSERLHGKAYEAYVSGLRSLLAEFKARQCKDFDAISQAIIDYRSRFYGDRSRVLPLGDVGL